ncbi:matrin 3-like 1.2 [Astatotilapia calliptera]|uniref:Matrin 3-like 1.1 n=1 Tax=Astatotilapia calliptera TaxID=8154 RepID=A0A3P8Q324_ASTCA|nr:matrin-3 [Astatotilapia calliptera]XP_026040203.1 matrin-3 [Astatotilapia calliptera]XP_026040208.1 matrin-3 [Astatotilapia calliptera]XP_026040217.1 matrin-3 [Astatotilapia calliptera]
MSQKTQADGAQKHFAVGRGLLAAAETLNFNMNEQRPNRPMGVGVGMGMEGQDGSGQMSRRGSGGGGSTSNLGSTMKLFASLGLSPSDLDALAEIPEEEISVETLPHILRQLKSRKGEAGERRAAMSSDAAYRGGSWEEGHVGRMGGSSLGQGSAKSSTDFGYSSLQDVSSGRGYGLNYSGGGGGGSRERPYSELSHRSGLGMGPSEPVFMQRRMGSPSNGKVQDFLGVMPPMFPHVCSLCDFDVHSTMEWNQHINGLRHAENRRQLLDMYPEWDPGMGSGRGGGLSETPNLSAGLLGPAPMSSGPMGGMSSSWGGGGGPGQLGLNKLRSRVVVVKYDRKPLSNKTLFAFAERFGCLREHLILKNKAFLEMSTHEEALDVVNYYKQHPASLYGKSISFYLSQTLMFIEKDERSMDRPMDRLMDRPVREVKGQASKVVFFSNLPREDEKKKELLTIAERFGVVEKHLFLTDQAFIQLGTAEDAEMLVKYYTVNPLTIRGRRIRLNVCTKYKTLNVNARKGGGDASNRKSGKANSTSSGTGTRTSSKTTLSKSSTSRSKEDKKREEKEEEKKEEEEKEEKKVKAEPEEEEEEEEEKEVSGVMEGGEDGEGEEQAATDGEGEESEGAESVNLTVEESEDARQEEEEEKKEEEKVTDDVTDDTPGDTSEVKQEAESEPQTEAAETETSAEEHESKEEANMEAAESSEAPEAAEGDLPEEEQDFPENMEDFVTLDELEEDNDEAHGESDNIDNTRRGGMRVVNIVGFRRGYQYLNELLKLAQPFGKVVKHLVLDLRPEAFLQFATEEEARAMANFYNGNITASVCGRPVRISHSMSYPTIQSGSSKVVYIGQLPNSKYTDEEILKFAEPFGKVKKYFLNRIRRECFLEMYNAEDAEKMAADYKAKSPKLNGKRLTIYVSRKYKQLKHGHRTPNTVKRASDDSPQKFSKDAEEPPAKKPKEEAQPEVEEEKKEDVENQKEEKQQQEEEMETPDVSEETAVEEKSAAEKVPEVSAERSSEDEKQEELVEQMETSTNQSGETEAPPPAENKPSVASMPLPPYDPNTPIGVEHVKAGFYCRICFLFYSNEDTAKKTHCSSQAHYDKLQKYLEKEQSKAEKKVKTTTP